MKISCILFVVVLNICACAQEYGFGVSLDSNLYANTPTAVNLMRGDYDNLPKAVSLKQYSPTPGNQGPTSTCAGCLLHMQDERCWMQLGMGGPAPKWIRMLFHPPLFIIK